MLAGVLLAFREGLEATLIVGILLGSLKKLKRADLAGGIWLGVGSAGIVSAVVTAGLAATGAELEGASEAAFEGLTVVLAACVLTWMIFWMGRQGRFAREGLEKQVRQVVSSRHNGGLFVVAFVAVLREGIELALFLTAAAVTSSARQTWMGGVLGLALAVAFGWAVFASTVRLNLRRFFQVTGVILLVFAAGLVARGIHEFVELGWLPALMNSVWNTASALSDQSVLGQVAESLLGYRSSPTLAEVIGYIIYLAVALGLLWRTSHTPSPTAGVSHTP